MIAPLEQAWANVPRLSSARVRLENGRAVVLVRVNDLLEGLVAVEHWLPFLIRAAAPALTAGLAALTAGRRTRRLASLLKARTAPCPGV